MSDIPKNHPMLIQISGYARAGKDTVAGVLVRDAGFQQYAYAARAKELARQLTVLIPGPDGELIELPFWDGRDETKRHPCAQLGGKARKIIDPDVWVTPLIKDPQFVASIATTGAVVSDCRYVNEHEAGKALAKKLCVPYSLWWIENPDVQPQGEEAEYTTPLRALADVTIHNGGGIPLAELEQHVHYLATALTLF